MFQAFTPKFIKKYAEIAPIVIEAYKQYNEEIKSRQFPTDDYVYHVIGDIAPFQELFAEYDAKLDK